MTRHFKTILFAVALLIIAYCGEGLAASVVAFGTAASCPTYCQGFTTSDPSVTLEYVSSGQVGLSVNGKFYANRYASEYETVLTVISNTFPVLHSVRQVANVPYTAYDGSVLFATITYDETTRQVNSGRAHGYLTKDTVLGGTLTLP